MQKAICVLLILSSLTALFAGCKKSETDGNPRTAAFSRNVAREIREDGWVYSFVYTWTKDPDPERTDNWYYQFFGFNIRYKYDPDYVSRIVREPEDPEKGKTYTEITYPAALVAGDGPAAEARDMALIGKILDSSQTVDQLLALSPGDYTFESIDKEMFFRLMRQALTGQPQKEGPIPEDDTKVSYWDLPSWAMMVEPAYTDGYRF